MAGIIAVMFGAAAWCAAPAADDPWAVEAFSGAPPREAAEPVRALLGDSGFRVTRSGKTLAEVWWVRAVPAAPGKPDGSVMLPGVPEGTLFGAARIGEGFRDIRGQAVKPGVYTLRYGVQPADGDHLGLTDWRDFLVMVPADLDPRPDPIRHDPLVKAGRKASRTTHPAVIMLRPVEGRPAKLPATATAGSGAAALRFVQTSIPFRTKPDGPIADVPLGVVLIGTVKAG